jgi:hypothetical protein
MKKITFLLMISLSFFAFNGCAEDDEVINYVSFESTSYNFGVELAGSTTNEIKIYATKTTGSDRTFNVSVDTDMSTADPASYEVQSSVTIPANTNVGVFTVKISDLNISENGETLVLKIDDQEDLFTGEKIVLNVKQVCPLNEVILDIQFDNWPEETGWELIDSNDNVIATAPFGTYAGQKQEEFSKAFCLENGTYTFIIYDAYEDGTHYYRLSYNGTILAEGGAFGAYEATTFEVSM